MTLFPFTAIVGQPAMQTALVVSAIDPGIGGVLIRGQKGTAKSTAARSLASLLPMIEVVAGCAYQCQPDDPATMHDDCRERLASGEVLPREQRPVPFVDLPLSATEDRLVGTLQIEKTLRTGVRHFEPGLLARANRGVLYVDEVNLLPDHLVDLLLDVAASGRNVVEREGVCFRHPARFVLIGSMNPEEGELRPQFLDRFGLCVSVSGLSDAGLRRQVVLDRLAFEEDDDHFVAKFADQEERLRRQIVQARRRLSAVLIPDEIVDRAVQWAARAEVQGHRAELTMVRTARALAAFCERPAITHDDLAEAAHFALPHRLDSQFGADPEAAAGRIEGLLNELPADQSPASLMAGSDDAEAAFMEDIDFPGSAAAGSMLFTFLKKKSTTATSARMRRST